MTQYKTKLCKSESDLNEFLSTLEVTAEGENCQPLHTFYDVKFSTVHVPTEGIQESFLVIYSELT